MAQNGWILAKFFSLLRVYVPRPSRSPLTHKTERGRYPAISIDRTSSVKKEFLIQLSGKFLRDTAGSRERAKKRLIIWLAA